MMAASDYKILIIDEDPEMLAIMSRFLEKAGYRIDTQTTGMEGLESVRKDIPDILLLDFMMPDISGLDICQQLKSNPAFNRIYIILLSGSFTQPEHIARGLRSGADGYLIRPVNEIELIARIEVACRLIDAEKSTRESEKKFRTLFEDSPTGISMTSFDGKMIMNKAFANMLGYEKEELTDKRFQEITHPADIENDLEKVRQLRKGICDAAHWEKRYIRKDGSIIWVEISVTAAKDDTGKPCYFITTILDLTQRILAEKELAESEAKFRSVFNTMAEGVALHHLIYDDTGKPADYRIMNVNPAFSVHTGIPAEKAIQATAAELYGSPPPFLDKYSRVALVGNPDSFEVFYEQLNKYFSISVSSPGKDRFVTIFQDITNRKISEQELRESREQFRELNQSLEKRVDARTAELTAANQELEAFAYTVSHDLRAPVRAIAGFTSILEEDHLSQLDAEGKRVFGIIRENTQKMDQLIDDLLTFSRLSRAEMNLSVINMKELAWLCYHELTTLSGIKPADFSVEEIPMIKGDYAMLKQVWINLISNALKFTGHCEAPRIVVGGRYQAGEFIYTIRDNGSGFNMQYVDKLFGVFQRLHSVKEYHGTGVGLAIVKRIIQRHGGRVWAVGEVGKGAEFSFTLMPG